MSSHRPSALDAVAARPAPRSRLRGSGPWRSRAAPCAAAAAMRASGARRARELGLAPRLAHRRGSATSPPATPGGSWRASASPGRRAALQRPGQRVTLKPSTATTARCTSRARTGPGSADPLQRPRQRVLARSSSSWRASSARFSSRALRIRSLTTRGTSSRRRSSPPGRARIRPTCRRRGSSSGPARCARHRCAGARSRCRGRCCRCHERPARAHHAAHLAEQAVLLLPGRDVVEHREAGRAAERVVGERQARPVSLHD